MGLTLRQQRIMVDVIHIIEIILIHGVLGISAYRRFNKSIVRSRGDFISLSGAAKSLIFIFWILSTEYVPFMKKRFSRKANMILNCIDFVFYGVIIGFTSFYLVRNGCVGIGCSLTYSIIALCSVLFVLSFPVALLSIKFWLILRRTGIDPKDQEDAEYNKPGQYSMQSHSHESSPTKEFASVAPPHRQQIYYNNPA